MEKMAVFGHCTFDSILSTYFFSSIDFHVHFAYFSYIIIIPFSVKKGKRRWGAGRSATTISLSSGAWCHVCRPNSAMVQSVSLCYSGGHPYCWRQDHLIWLLLMKDGDSSPALYDLFLFKTNQIAFTRFVCIWSSAIVWPFVFFSVWLLGNLIAIYLIFRCRDNPRCFTKNRQNYSKPLVFFQTQFYI